MADVNSLFFSQDPDKQTLHRRIVPNQKQQELQQERWNDLRDYLVANLNEVSKYEISSWLQGSYKFGTQVRPIGKGGEFDIDLGIYFKWLGNPNDGNFSPRELKALVQESLLRYKTEAEDVIEVMNPPKERCSRIRFPGNFHIDVPSYHLNEKLDRRALATEKDIWEYSDPKAFYVWFKDNFSEDESSQVRRLIRYFKIWSALKLKEPPSSILLTVLVAETYLNLTEDETDRDDIAIQYVSKKIAERLEANIEIPNPVDATENLNRLSNEEASALVKKFCELADLAEKAVNAPTELTTASLWAEAFQHFFPVPVQDPANPNGRALIPVRFIPEIHVEAIAKNNLNRTYNGENRIGPIPKNCQIKFTLKNTNALPQGARVRWIVRNEGEEAEYTNDLGHLAGTDLRHAEESSAYKGVHYMDIVITSVLGEVIGFRRIPVDISGIFMPPRNGKKPGYTRFRRRR